MTSQAPNSDAPPTESPGTAEAAEALRDIGDVPAVEVVTTVALHLMSAAAVKVGLGAAPTDQDSHHGAGQEAGSEAGPDVSHDIDLDEARTLITALAGLITAAGPRLGTFHAAPLRDGLKTLQLAFREASAYPDPPGSGPGEKLTGPVYTSSTERLSPSGVSTAGASTTSAARVNG